MEYDMNIHLYFSKKGANDKEAMGIGKLLKLIYGDQIEIKVGKGDKVLWDSRDKQEMPNEQ